MKRASLEAIGCGIGEPAIPADSAIEIRIAQGFLDRLAGVFAQPDSLPLLLLGCRWVHGFGLRQPVFLTFLGVQADVLAANQLLTPWRVSGRWHACHVLESFTPLHLRVGDRVLIHE